MSRFVTVRAAPDTAPLVDFLQRPASDWGSVEILKHERGTTVCVVSSPVGAIVVKRHALKSWRRRADAVVHGSPALRAWTGAALLERHGIAVPRPLAALERRDGAMLSECLYVSEALLTQVPLPVYWRQRCVGWSRQKRRRFIQALAVFLRGFHGAGLYAGDMKDANLLVEESGADGWRFYLVDLDRIRRVQKLGWERRLKNLVQLERTLGRSAKVTDRLFFLYQYLDRPLPDRRQRRRLLARLVALRDRKDREYARRRARRPLEPLVWTSAGDEERAAADELTVARRPVSCCIICFNEEKNIRRCLESVKWCDEIIVIDSFSTDRTVEICHAYDVRLIQRAWPGYVEQKRYALSHASHEWVLNIDADEEVSGALQAEIVAGLQRDDPAVDGFYVPRLVYYLGRWWWRGWYPSYRLRLFRRHKVRWGGVNPHEKVLLRGHADRLRNNLYHYTYEDIRDHLQTINHLTEVASHELAVRKRTPRGISIVARPLWRFFSFYVVRGCVREGVPGFVVAVIAAFYVFLKYAKLWEYTTRGEGVVETKHPARRSGATLGRRARASVGPHDVS